MANTSNTNKKKVSAEQLNMLVDFIGVNKVLLHGKTKPSEAQDDVIHKLWEEIAARLNSCGSGPAKPKAQWKKTFIDWKSNTRRKSRDLVKSQRRTGGGEDEIKGLTAAEEKLMSLLSWITVIGVEDVAEIGIDEAEKAVDNPSSSFITLPSSSSPPPSPVTVLPNIETTVQKRKWLNQHNAADSGPTLKKTKTAGKEKSSTLQKAAEAFATGQSKMLDIISSLQTPGDPEMKRKEMELKETELKVRYLEARNKQEELRLRGIELDLKKRELDILQSK